MGFGSFIKTAALSPFKATGQLGQLLQGKPLQDLTTGVTGGGTVQQAGKAGLRATGQALQGKPIQALRTGMQAFNAAAPAVGSIAQIAASQGPVGGWQKPPVSGWQKPPAQSAPPVAVNPQLTQSIAQVFGRGGGFAPPAPAPAAGPHSDPYENWKAAGRPGGVFRG